MRRKYVSSLDTYTIALKFKLEPSDWVLEGTVRWPNIPQFSGASEALLQTLLP